MAVGAWVSQRGTRYIDDRIQRYRRQYRRRYSRSAKRERGHGVPRPRLPSRIRSGHQGHLGRLGRDRQQRADRLGRRAQFGRVVALPDGEVRERRPRIDAAVGRALRDRRAAASAVSCRTVTRPTAPAKTTDSPNHRTRSRVKENRGTTAKSRASSARTSGPISAAAEMGRAPSRAPAPHRARSRQAGRGASPTAASAAGTGSSRALCISTSLTPRP